ncbi:MAG: thiamine phosphate synthase [Hyphomicrobiales bacterium]|nr:thiamine phosphate synthase [Hyphomicrobiales bacterium]
MTTVDLRLNAIIDPAVGGGHDIADLARRVAAGGATLVQLRDKGGPTHAMVEDARAIKAALMPFKVPFVVNDRVDVALAAGAEGVHVGQDDMAAADARRLLGPAAIVGLSVSSIAEAEAAPIECIDYVGIGSVFATASKPLAQPPMGPEGLARIAAMLRRRVPAMPICGIGGINADNASAVIGHGADGVAVISALSLTPDPAGAARALREIIDGMRAKRGA